MPLRLGRLLTRAPGCSRPLCELVTPTAAPRVPSAHSVDDCRYEDDKDEGEWFLYTGSGGRDLSGNKRTSKVPPPTPLSASAGVRA